MAPQKYLADGEFKMWMLRIWAYLETMKADRRGVTALEYGLIAAAMAAAVVGAMAVLTPKIGTVFTAIAADL